MNRTCPACGLEFERASGEITGGMGINIVVTLMVIIGGSLFALSPAVPMAPLLIGLLLFAVLFPIAFYRTSRGLWASLLYLTGDNREPDNR
jgi:ABC-type transport system involved in cytochrome bd biosynthesis fused ATPase/permease subunit